MAGKHLAVISSFLFFGLVVWLLLILYYPNPSSYSDEDADDEWTSRFTDKSWNNEVTESTGPRSRMEIVAKTLEDMGAGFLALLAVICVVFGLSCIFCAYCSCTA